MGLVVSTEEASEAPVFMDAVSEVLGSMAAVFMAVVSGDPVSVPEASEVGVSYVAVSTAMDFVDDWEDATGTIGATTDPLTMSSS